MFFESDYRRRAMARWQEDANAETAGNANRSGEQLAGLLERVRGRLASLLPHGRFPGKYE